LTLAAFDLLLRVPICDQLVNQAFVGSNVGKQAAQLRSRFATPRYLRVDELGGLSQGGQKRNAMRPEVSGWDGLAIPTPTYLSDRIARERP
jgi:hypothetical protein